MILDLLGSNSLQKALASNLCIIIELFEHTMESWSSSYYMCYDTFKPFMTNSAHGGPESCRI